MTQRFDVCVRGGGLVGTTLALLLAQQRLRVAQCVGDEPAASGDVRAYALNAASRRVLTAVCGWPAESSESPSGGTEDGGAVTPVLAMRIQADNGRSLQFDPPPGSQDPLAWIVDVQALETAVRHARRYQPQITVMGPSDPAPTAALTVVCEGKHSTSRAEWGFTFKTDAYPHHALAARVRLDTPHHGVAKQWFQPGHILAHLPVGGPNGHEVAVVWSLAAAQAQAVLGQPVSEFLAQMAAVCGLDASALICTAPPQAWPLTLAQADRWVATGVALAGDAAHTLHPLAGQGLNVGLADAAELANVLQQRPYWRALGDVRLLRQYERARKAAFNTMAGATDGLFHLFQHPQPWMAAARGLGLAAVNRLPPLKHWLVRQAAGVPTPPAA